jgi:cytochrome c-type protein NapC
MPQQSLFKSLLGRKVAFGATIGGALIFMIIGVVLWGGFNWGMEITNTETFCISCHEMRDNVYAEYVGTVHDANRSGVKATCPDCHVPRPWIHKMVRKIQASNEVLHKVLGTVDTPEKFNNHRMTMARRVWDAMKSTDSRECRNCHDWDTMNPEKQKPRARNQHLFAMENGNTCIDCHKGIAHHAVHQDVPEEEMEKLSAPMAAYKTPIPQSFLDGLERVKVAEAEAEAKQQEAAKKEREQRQAQAAAHKKQIEEAVAKALAAAQAGAPAPAAAPTESAPAAEPAASAGGAEGFGIDWGQVPERMITLFYPGQTSMEWTLVGTKHGGARPFMAGDRCVTCHDREVADMGKKMVNGEKAETTPIPGKRASIPVQVQAGHDGSNLYFRFQWEETDHVPVPFADGGKLDPAHEVKLALMLATDDVKYASQAGCWGTCHEDLRGMPAHPDKPELAGLDLNHGVTKYIAASRTEIEEKGRGGAVLGGWDKLKSADEVRVELDNGQFMDLLRWNSDGKLENGHILEQRHMDGGSDIESWSSREGGRWTLVLKRPLASGKPGDLGIEAGKLYNFGFAIHDDFANARFHHVSLGYRLGLDNPEAEVNAVKVEASVSAPTAAAPAPVAAAPAAPVEAAPAAASGADPDAGIDWGKAGERTITLFYPGQTSMEWTLVGTKHGGARPFMAGDRCVTCHDREVADMGKKMINGEKAETTPIPGKRPAIPVTLQSTHDAENLYLKFQWEGSDHVPVPFVDGGKMDPDHEVKLALMLATDDVQYATQAGCWGTCHEDLRGMPGHPEKPELAGLDLSQGVTKYIAASRTEIEEKGRKGPLGGWDKLKSADEVQAELHKGIFMDLLRVRSGEAQVEDGHILEERHMGGGQGFEAKLNNDGGLWTLVLKRKLKSDKPGDISIEPGKMYNFGFAIHDDFANARYHHVSLGYHLALDDEKAEVNLVGQ